MPASHHTLDQLQLGQRAEIQSVEGNDTIAARLLEMGLLPGETIEMVGRSPLGDPTEFSVMGYRISLRRSESVRVVIAKPTS